MYGNTKARQNNPEQKDLQEVLPYMTSSVSNRFIPLSSQHLEQKDAITRYSLLF